MQILKDKYENILIGLSAIGLIDALYLSYARYAHVDLPCSITNGGCSVVAASPYAVMFGVPLAYLGVVFYLFMICIVLLYKFKPELTYIREGILLISVFSILDSIYFLYLQGFVIKAFCIYCIFSAIITFCMLVPAYLLYNNR